MGLKEVRMNKEDQLIKRFNKACKNLDAVMRELSEIYPHCTIQIDDGLCVLSRTEGHVSDYPENVLASCTVSGIGGVCF